MKQASVSIYLLAALTISFLCVPRAGAYSTYSVAKNATNCRACHGDFRASPYISRHDGVSWADSLHNVHRNTMLNRDCNACHSASGWFPVLIHSSAGGTGLDPISCLGCHGRAQDKTGIGTEGAGLRQHHWRNGVTSCVDCHDDSDPSAFTPVGENVKPPYYANPGTNHPNMPTDPCNLDGKENFAGGPTGLDNDGNNFYDAADPACVIPCEYTLSPSNATFAASGGIGNFTVNTIASCVWTATSQAAWISITSGSPGAGTGTVNYAVAVNATTLARTGTVAVATAVFTVTQAGQCTYSINPTSASYGAAGGSGSVTVTAPTGCAWTAASNDAWITVTSGASGSGSGTVGYSVAANTSSISRTGTVTIAGLTFTVTQAGVACTYSINPTSAFYGAAGGSGSVTVTAPAGCPWTATSNDAWITVTSGASGSGSGTVDYSVAANPSSIARTGTVTIAGLTFTVTQAGVACTYSINPTSAFYGAAGGSGSVTVTAPTGCAWTAASNDAWITVTSGASGSGSGTVNYSVAANTDSSPRMGTITIAGQTFTVNQEGFQPGVLDLDIARFRVGKRGSVERARPVRIILVVKNNGLVEGSALATVVGGQNGVEVYRETLTVSDPVGDGSTRYEFPSYTPTASGIIIWTATIADEDPDIDEATAGTIVP